MTTFISAASLNFLKQRDFLSGAWFQKIIWEEEFEKSKKYTFDAAPDEELYNRVLEEVQAQTGKFFIWLQTISFHLPYNTPLWKTEELALEYSDEELYKFYEWLQQLWFFDNWILVIVWDHRKMTSVEEWESEIFGPNRYTRSVATVVWSWIEPWIINPNIEQHTDFYNSLKRLIWHWRVEVDSVYNDIFTQETGRNRWITNSSVYIENWYTVSSYSWDTLLFKNLSNLSEDNPVHDYFSSYISFEFGDGEYEKENNTENDKIKFIWHRWAIENSPENTLESFLVANELWADWIEFDVSYTKDHENVVVHGESLYASNCNKQKIWNLNFDRIQKNCTIKNWEKYMKLQKMLELIDWLFDYYFLEIKVYDEKLWAQQALEAIQTVKDLNMQDRVIFISYSDAAREVLDADPDIIYWWDTFDVNDLDFIWENNSKYFLAPYDMLTPEVVERAKSLWKEVVTYTVNETWDFQTVKDLWVDIIMTDRISSMKEYESINI
jgi:glycerophosphoryl diester phosphodiesterase